MKQLVRHKPVEKAGVSPFEWFALGALAMCAAALTGIASAMDKQTRHLGNVADRLLEIDNTLKKRH